MPSPRLSLLTQYQFQYDIFCLEARRYILYNLKVTKWNPVTLGIFLVSKDMKRETDWKLIFVFEFDTLLFELKLLRPAFELLFALLPTSNVFFSPMSVHKVQNSLNIFLRIQRRATLSSISLFITIYLKFIPYTVSDRKRETDRKPISSAEYDTPEAAWKLPRPASEPVAALPPTSKVRKEVSLLPA